MFIQPTDYNSVQVPAICQYCARYFEVRKLNKTVVVREIKIQWDSDIPTYNRLFYKLQSLHSYPLHLSLPPFKITNFK